MNDGSHRYAKLGESIKLWNAGKASSYCRLDYGNSLESKSASDLFAFLLNRLQKNSEVVRVPSA